MNKKVVIERVAVISGVEAYICELVLTSFEEVLTDELNSSKWKGSLFDKLYALMSLVKTKKESKAY